MKMNHKSIPSLSSSISTNNGEILFNHTPRTSSSSTSSYQNQHQFYNISAPSIAPKQTNLSHSNSLRSNYTINPIQDDKYKRYSEPPPMVNSNSSKRWDDSQLEMELAEDDLIDKKKKVRRNSSLRLKQKIQLSAETSSSYIFDKFRHRSSTDDTIDAFKQSKNSKKLSNSLKKVCDWLF